MNEYRLELYIDHGDEGSIKISSLKEKTDNWKKDVEARALSEYYKQRIKVTVQKV